MVYVFISYSHNDKVAADYLALELKKRGADIFLDTETMKGGENWRQKLQEEIIRCDALVVLWSENSTKSEWVDKEIIYAGNYGKKIIPIRLDTTPLPITLVAAQAIDFTGWPRPKQTQAAVNQLASALTLIGKHTPDLPSLTLWQRVKYLFRFLLRNHQLRGVLIIGGIALISGIGLFYFAARSPSPTNPDESDINPLPSHTLTSSITVSPLSVPTEIATPTLPVITSKTPSSKATPSSLPIPSPTETSTPTHTDSPSIEPGSTVTPTSTPTLSAPDILQTIRAVNRRLTQTAQALTGTPTN